MMSGESSINEKKDRSYGGKKTLVIASGPDKYSSRGGGEKGVAFQVEEVW